MSGSFDANREDLVVGVIGAGAMGQGIVQVSLQGGMRVVLFDAKEGGAKAGADLVAQRLDRSAERGSEPVLIVADDAVVGVVGTSCSGAAAAAAPLISEANMVMISGSNTSPSLTSDLACTAGENYYPGYYRTAHNDLYQGAAMAAFVYNDLGMTTAAAIHDGDPYTEGLASAFADVSENFTQLFGLLFPGGSGKLKLTHPDDLLNTGIEVEAKPSGKNVKKLSLLSGGERSLTALAYLFAVFRSRPSPFYVMDEVEAALDDVNLYRFLGLVGEFRKDAQLIIVSHQKRTMEAGDVLCGVSMQPGGSSKVITERASPDRVEAADTTVSSI